MGLFSVDLSSIFWSWLWERVGPSVASVERMLPVTELVSISGSMCCSQPGALYLFILVPVAAFVESGEGKAAATQVSQLGGAREKYLMSTELKGRLRRLPEPRKILSGRNDTGGPHQENQFLRTDIYWFGVLRCTLFFCKIF